LQGLRKIVVVSSGAVYGEPASFPITEASPLAPISPYGASKLVAETEARMFESAYSVPAVIARIFNTYGPRMPRFVVFDFLRKLQKDPMRLEILGSGRQVRDLNYVSDTVDGLLTLAAQGLPGESYNIASGTSHAVTEIAQALLSILGLDGRTTLAFTGESWAGDAQRWEVEIGKLRQLGYEPEIGLKEGLRRVAEWFESVYGPLPATPDSELRTLNSEPRTP
jgi:nucleoside-diphosphate-sugar epimerase